MIDADAQIIDGVLYGCDAYLTDWVDDRIGTGMPARRSPAVAMGFLVPGTGKLGAACIFYDFDGDDITFGAAIEDKRAMTRKLYLACHDYVFTQLQCKRCTAFVHETNKPAIRVVESIGFVLEGKKQVTDICMYGLLASNAGLWISQKDYQNGRRRRLLPSSGS